MSFQKSLGFLSQADGSAFLKHGKDNVVCSVYGPMEVKMKDEILDSATIQVVFKSNVNTVNNALASQNELALKKLLDGLIYRSEHPRSLIKVCVQIVNGEGENLALVMNAVYLALADAGIPLNYSIAAAECEGKKGKFLFCFGGNGDEIVYSQSVGNFDIDDLQRACQECRELAKQTSDDLALALERKVSKFSE